MSAAFLAGVAAGYGVALPMGPIAVLIAGLSARTSLRVGAAAGLGAATADGVFAAVAVAGGAAVAAAVAPIAGPLRWVAAVVLLVLAGMTARTAFHDPRQAEVQLESDHLIAPDVTKRPAAPLKSDSSGEVRGGKSRREGGSGRPSSRWPRGKWVGRSWSSRRRGAGPDGSARPHEVGPGGASGDALSEDRRGAGSDRSARPHEVDPGGASCDVLAEAGSGRGPVMLVRAYAGVLGLTLLNPATIVYFAALVLGRGGEGGGVPFVAGVLVASASWQLSIAAGGALVGRRLTSDRGRLITALVSSAVIAVLAVRLLA